MTAWRRSLFLHEMGIAHEWMLRVTETVTASVAPVHAAAEFISDPATVNAANCDTSATPSTTQELTASGGSEQPDWTALRHEVADCTRCGLCATRTQTVFGVGDRHAEWLLIGEAPGENEDLQGEPFVGQAGKLLDNMLKAIGLDRRHQVYIANVLKCRPPRNRDPQPDEVTQCEPYLLKQIELLQPKLIVVMGRFAAQTILRTDAAIGKLRGSVHQYAGVPVIVTYHPAYLLRSLHDKARAWEDWCLAVDVAARQKGTPL